MCKILELPVTFNELVPEVRSDESPHVVTIVGRHHHGKDIMNQRNKSP